MLGLRTISQYFHRRREPEVHHSEVEGMRFSPRLRSSVIFDRNELDEAVARGQLNLALALRAKWGDFKDSHLWVSVKNNDREMVRAILSSPSVTKEALNESVRTAVRGKRQEALKAILENSSQISSETLEGCIKYSAEMLRLSSGVDDRSLKSLLPAYKEFNPAIFDLVINCAAAANSPEIITLLLNQIENMPPHCHNFKYNLINPLQNAVKEQNSEVARLLLDRLRAAPRSFLLLAEDYRDLVTRTVGRGDLPAVRLLYDRAALKSPAINHRLMLIAAACGEIELVNYFLTKGADLFLLSESKLRASAHHVARSQRYREVACFVSLLKDRVGNSPHCESITGAAELPDISIHDIELNNSAEYKGILLYTAMTASLISGGDLAASTLLYDCMKGVDSLLFTYPFAYLDYHESLKRSFCADGLRNFAADLKENYSGANSLTRDFVAGKSTLDVCTSLSSLSE